SLAYSVDTVLTWSSWLTPVNLFFSALLAGPVIAVLTYACAGLELRRLSLACTLLALVALVLGTVFLVIHENSLAAITNYEFSAADLLPTYTTTIVVHVISGGLGVALAFSSLRQRLSRNNRLLLLVCSCLCLLIAVFLPRVAFYALHMTAGF
ncbi:MAG: dimethyl sulfoxide reductase anchor subunit, partial [Coriobacteriales bacterium]|nr:dimethyl sulfoxide reductase anchor subunit [Coriobacteriales bacterium]